ncbi:MAG: response regulator, partial [Flavobacterium sp.]
MQGKFKRNLIISSAVSVLILLISSTASLLSIRSLLDSNALVGHTQEVIYNINAGRASLLDAQTGVRGFLLTGREIHRQQYITALSNVDQNFENVRALTLDNPGQQQSLKELDGLNQEFFDYIAARVAEKMNNQAQHPDTIGNGTLLLDNIRKIITRMETAEQKLLEERTTESARYATYSIILIVAAALIALIISLLFFTRILKDYSARLLLQQELEKSEKETAERIKVISTIAGQIAEGNYEIRVNDSESDALGSVAVSLNNMGQALGRSFKSLSDKEWLQAGIAELNQVMIGEKTLEQLTKDVVDYLAHYTNSSAGVLYLIDGNDLYSSAGYSYIPNESRRRFKVGDGLTGQAVQSRKIMELKSLKADDIKISYALGEINPGHVIAVPLMDILVEGAVELASVSQYSALQVEFLSSVANNIGIAIKAAQNRKRVQELLEETEAQSEELRVQHSELESMNAELETQTEKLQASEEELRVQQEELQQTNEELAERSVLLEEKNTEIQKKSEDLELTTRYKSEFLANMSHELRTPLNSILLLSRLLSENNDSNMNSEQIEFAKVIQSSGNGLLGLIDEILDLSKIEAGKMDLELMDIPTTSVTDNLRDLFTEVAKQKGIEFNIVLQDAPLVIRTDKMRLEQILKNLISNAIKFTSAGAVTLTVKKHATEDKIISFTVKDTGIGIPREKQPLIFEAFQQADGSTKRKYGGTGLGLSISRELAKLLKGEITLKSAVNEGSEFTLSVPVSGAAGIINSGSESRPSFAKIVQEEEVKRAENPNAQYISPSIPENVPDDRDKILPGEKVILIVEDDINFAKSLLEFTRKRGYKGIVSVRGDYALNLAINYKPVGVLLDIQLPIKSGWEVMEELKNSPQTKHIPVHIMSSHKLKQESLLKGAVNFLDKPVAFEQIPEIFKRIEHIVNKESQKVLIIEDNSKHAKALAFFLESNNINSEIKSEVNEGVSALQQEDIDCVILDMGVPDNQAYEILEGVKKNPGLENLPVIVFTGKSLSMKEEVRIKKYADSIIIKTAHSYQRMLDEVSLFLHIVEEGKKEGRR